MASRLTVALAVVFLLSGVSVASAEQAVEPQPGVLLSGTIKFPRAQAMSVQTDPRDGSKLTAYMGFDGKLPRRRAVRDLGVEHRRRSRPCA